MAFQKGHKINLGKKRTLKFRLSRQGKRNPHWKGDKVTRRGLHWWIRQTFGNLKKCEHCGTKTAKKYDWSNKNHLYKRDMGDWQRLCRSCHQKYDWKNGLRKLKK